MPISENTQNLAGEARGQKWPVEIAGGNLVFQRHVLRDPMPSGQQIIAAAGHHDARNYIVLQWLPDGAIEELRLEELTDIVGRGIERFIVVESDRSFRLEVEGLRLEWPAAPISGATVKALAGQNDDTLAVVLARENQPDRVIEDEEIVSLDAEGLEIFKLRPRPAQIEISVNGKAFTVRRGVHTGLEIKQAAINAGVAIQLDFILSLETGGEQTRIIGDRDRIHVKPGQSFLAIADDDNS
jgi:hypothetical protein